MTQVGIDHLVTRVLDLAASAAPATTPFDARQQSFDDHLTAARPTEPVQRPVDRTHDDRRDASSPRPHDDRAESTATTSSRSKDADQRDDSDSIPHEPTPDEIRNEDRVDEDQEVVTTAEETGQEDAATEIDAQEEGVPAVVVVPKTELPEAALSEPELPELPIGELREQAQPTVSASVEAELVATKKESPESAKQAAETESPTLASVAADVDIATIEESAAVQQTDETQDSPVTPVHRETVVATDRADVASDDETAELPVALFTTDQNAGTNQQPESSRTPTAASQRSESSDTTPPPSPQTSTRESEPKDRRSSPKHDSKSDTRAADNRATPVLAPTNHQTPQVNVADAAIAALDAAAGDVAKDAAGSSPTSQASSAPIGATSEKAPDAFQQRVADQTASRRPITDAQAARFVQRVAGAFQSARQGDGEVRLRLHPPELGSLRIQIKVENGSMVARLEAENQHTRQILLENLPSLRERLAAQDIRIDRFDVDVPDHSSSNRQQQAKDQQNASQRDTHTQDDSAQTTKAEETHGKNEQDGGQVIAGDRLNVVV